MDILFNRIILICVLTLLVTNFALVFWKLLVSEFLLEISEILHCSMFVFHVKTVPLLDAHQLLMLSAGKLMYLEPDTFCLNIFYNIVQSLTMLIILLQFNYYYSH
jgi:hypothetical protein